MTNTKSRLLAAGAALLLTLAACGTSGDGTPAPSTTPTVLSLTPANGATGVPLNGSITATFSEAMDPATLTATTFTLTSGTAATAVPGAVTYANSTAMFKPAGPLPSSASLTATITTGAKSALGVGLAAKRAWSFTTATSAAATPTVLSNIPLTGATNVALNGAISATFSEAMNPATLTASTFALTYGTPPVAVQGTVTYANSTASFWPAAYFASASTYSATVSVGAMSAAGVALASSHAWSFTTGSTTVPGLPVNLGTAGAFAILAKSGISTVPTSAVTGDLGVSPAAASYITGFSLIADSTNVFATSLQVTGRVFASDYAPPTPSNMTTAVGDMELAFTDAAGRAPDVTELGAGNIGGMTLTPGVYKWGTGLLIPTDVTLNGSATGVWIFQIAQDLTFSSGAKIVMAGGALPKNVFWQVAGLVEIGTTAHCEGVILTQTSVALRTGATIKGRLLAQTGVTIDGSTVVEPAL